MARIQDLVQRHADDAQGAYGQLLLGLQGAWLGFANGMGNPIAARMQLAQQAGDLVRSYTPLLRSRVRDAIVAAHHQGELDAEGQYQSGPEHAFIEESQDTIEAAAARDARGVVLLATQALQRYQVARGRMPEVLARQAALGELPSQGRDVFVQLDRLQRKRNSGEFVAASLRMAMFATYAHSFGATLAGQGVDTLVAEHPEKPAQELSLLNGFTAWCAENVHPNTRWSLRQKKAPA